MKCDKPKFRGSYTQLLSVGTIETFSKDLIYFYLSISIKNYSFLRLLHKKLRDPGSHKFLPNKLIDIYI